MLLGGEAVNSITLQLVKNEPATLFPIPTGDKLITVNLGILQINRRLSRDSFKYNYMTQFRGTLLNTCALDLRKIPCKPAACSVRDVERLFPDGREIE